MPELPEVETVVQSLKKVLLGKKVSDIEVKYNKIIRMPVDDFKEKLIGLEIKDITRKAKYLIFDFGDLSMVSHLRMEGKFHYNLNKRDSYGKHEHIIFYFSDGSELIYDDVRKFGEMHLKNNQELFLTEPLKKLGPDANTDIDQKIFAKALKKTIPVKSFLLDQTIIAGIGNIYADEILFDSKIHPLRPANSLTSEDLRRILGASKTVLNKAINLGGTTIKSFSSGDISGLFQNELCVHTKKGEACPTCQTIIEKIKVGGRGTYFCSVCQK
ncbi:MAG: DNA-formamidopyrimidine glycosylase [Erysipelotrichales bacterium]|nr:DNA-formamidopyrimidine glycosylase [Erysipelotrichales bacterium]